MSTDRYIEQLLALIGILSIPLGVRRSLWYWPCSILITLGKLYTSYNDRLNGTLATQLLTLLFSIYGWYWWRRGALGGSYPRLALSPLNQTDFAAGFGIGTGVFGALYLLGSYTGASYILLDALKGAVMSVAHYMHTQKKVETYAFWTLYNLLAVVLYCQLERSFFALQYMVYLLVGIYSFFSWRRDWLRKEKGEERGGCH